MRSEEWGGEWGRSALSCVGLGLGVDEEEERESFVGATVRKLLHI